MIKAYIFDLFGTLAYYTMKEKLRDLLSREEHEQLLITPLHESTLAAEKRAQVAELLNKSQFHLYEDSERIIEKLKKNYKLGIISNVYELSAKKTKKEFSSFFKNFDAIALSSELGIMKPNHKIFFYVLNKLGVRPEEAVMVGDIVDRDIVPAKQLGLRTILIDRNNQKLEELI